jgi:simple sugar transport system permease protein
LAAPRSVWQSVLVTFLAFVTALLVGALLIAFTDTNVLSQWSYVFSDPGSALSATWHSVYVAYSALFTGAFGSKYALSETLTQATPLIFTGLAVGVAFKAGLFNIGAEGQLLLGGLAAAAVAFSFPGLPAVVYLPFALLAGAVGGAIWGFIPGFLRAKTGAHEVITTIMLNFVATFLFGYMLRGTFFRRAGRTDQISKIVYPAARLPHLAGSNLRIHSGIIIALVVAAWVWWLLNRSTKGFEIRAVGLNPDGARTAGISVAGTWIFVMILGAASQLLGLQYSLAPGFSANLGFDAIALALLGRANPGGIVAAAILFGALRAGAIQMQAVTSIPTEIAVVIQALIIIFVAAPALVRAVYRIKARPVAGPQVLAKGWGG